MPCLFAVAASAALIWLQWRLTNKVLDEGLWVIFVIEDEQYVLPTVVTERRRLRASAILIVAAAAVCCACYTWQAPLWTVPFLCLAVGLAVGLAAGSYWITRACEPKTTIQKGYLSGIAYEAGVDVPVMRRVSRHLRSLGRKPAHEQSWWTRISQWGK